ncbi:MAG: hypothetical protein H6738_15415 [Alphaproteobacteria bacterium]|nr:hypothetical protein [Alphaproteobacteria bacterium]MCB9698167.1 hypothetical protein [Alphaproteobacteria bacterium]
MRTVAFALVLLACSAEEPAPTRGEGHGGGAGYWPPDSRTAVRGSFAQGLDVELDVVLTRDRVPVLALSPLVDTRRCQIDGEPVVGFHRWDELGSRELSGVACGGFPEPDFPNAVVVGETPITLDEVLDLLLDAPDDITVHLDILHEPGFTPAPERFAEAVLDRWIEADRPQDLVISGRRPELIAAFEGHGRERGFDVTTLLDLPLIEPSDGWGSLVVEDLGARITNTQDYVRAARDAGADGVTVLADLADRRQLEVARREGLITSVWTVDGEERLRPWLDRVDVVVTDYPGDLP